MKKQKLDHYVNGDEVRAALVNWHKVMNPDYPNRAPYRFSTFIGHHDLVPKDANDHPYSRSWGWMVTELAANKIRMLASPHHYALLKAFKAKTGWQGKIP